MKKIVLGTAFIMLISCFAFGADIDGKWSGEMGGMGMDMTLNFTFKAEGATLTGTTGPEGMGMDSPISEGKIDGNNISFVVVVDMMGSEMRITYKGTIEGNEIKLSMDMGMGDPMQMTIKKAK
jgi:hypothetical protein